MIDHDNTPPMARVIRDLDADPIAKDREPSPWKEVAIIAATLGAGFAVIFAALYWVLR